jgi:hypothetical protein
MGRKSKKTPTHVREDVYVNYGHYLGWRDWRHAVEHNYVSGCGERHVMDLRRLEPGERIWVYAPGNGYFGVAVVETRAQAASAFRVKTPEGECSILDVIKGRTMAAHHAITDLEECEHYVSVRWLQSVPPLKKAIYAKRPIFSSRNVVCRPTVSEWHDTLGMLKQRFPAWNS